MKKKILKAGLIFGLVFFTNASAAQTEQVHFCERPGTYSIQEKIICKDYYIRDLDNTLNEFYKAALSFSKSKEA
ncbi:MAG: hypothetical protein ACNA7Y_06255, partial [Gammaproteobacteria bacterium]